MDLEIKQSNSLQSKPERQSGIELLKIIAIISIVTSHLVQSLQTGNAYIIDQDYALDLQQATADPQIFLLILMRYGGVFGNSIFFVCSAWFLLDDMNGGGQRVRKILHIVIDVWIVSIICLIISEFILGGEVSISLVIRSIFPTTFSNNWYMTCYILFLAIYPYLNRLIYSINHTELLRCCIGLGFIYIGVDFIIGERFFSTNLVLWITIYFCIAYMKQYMKGTIDNKKRNILLVIIGVFGNVLIIFITDVLGLKISLFSSMLLHWADNSNPFLILAVIGLFNLFRGCDFQNRLINKIAGLSMLVYLIHDNLLIRNYFRPLMFQCVYSLFGYDYILLWVWMLTIGVFIVSLFFAFIYKETIQRLTLKFSNWVSVKLHNGYKCLEGIILQE